MWAAMASTISTLIEIGRANQQIARSIQRFGFNNPILVDDNLQIIAGHGRVEAAKLLSLKEVPIVRLSRSRARLRKPIGPPIV